ncbi:MAG: hypothetical protein V7K92_28165 [Nostoc sp.]
MGFSTQSRRPVESRKRVRYYRLNTDDVIFVQKVMEYRLHQREERETKRHQLLSVPLLQLSRQI